MESASQNYNNILKIFTDVTKILSMDDQIENDKIVWTIQRSKLMEICEKFSTEIQSGDYPNEFKKMINETLNPSILEFAKKNRVCGNEIETAEVPLPDYYANVRMAESMIPEKPIEALNIRSIPLAEIEEIMAARNKKKEQDIADKKNEKEEEVYEINPW